MNSESINTQIVSDNLKHPLLSGCNVCGRNHKTEECSFLRELKPVPDSKAPSRARLTLPANLEVQNLADNSTTVIARAPFPRNVQFGPFVAKHTQMLNPAVNFPLKVFGKTEESSYYLDTTDEEACNWMCLVTPATSCKDQNLICYQMDQNIFFTVMKDIQPGEQLKVWYAPYYAVKMGVVPFTLDLTANVKKDSCDEAKQKQKEKEKEKERKNFHGMLLSREVTEKLAQQLPAKQLGARQVPDTWRCKLCSTEETSVVMFAKHLMGHYKRSLTVQGDKLLSCHICHMKFANEKMLVKHKVVRHKVKVQRPRLLENVEEEEEKTEADETEEEEGENGMTSIVIANLTPQFSQNGAQTIFVTNTNEVFPDAEVNDSQNEALNVLLEQLQSETAFTTDSSATKDNPDPNENHSSNILATSSNFDSAVIENCEDIGNDLLTKIQLQTDEVLHSDRDKPEQQVQVDNNEFLNTFQSCTDEVASQSNERSNCTKEPGINVQNNSLLNLISCTGLGEESKSVYDVNTSFIASDDVGPPYNCDICNKEFHKADYLYRHLRKHTGEFTCVSCLAVFARKESLVNHSCFVDNNSQSENKSSRTCPYCQKVFRMKKMLKRHVAKHTGEWKCNSCQRIYSSRATLAAHRCTSKKTTQMYRCQVCSREFLRQSYLNKHLLLHREMHPCSTCGKKLPAGEALTAHQDYCSQEKLLETAREATCPNCSTTFVHVLTYRQHVLEHTHPLLCQQCGRRFSTNETKVLHSCTNKMLQCDLCLKSFSHMSELVQHNAAHGVPQFHCYECGNSFHHNESYVKHVCNAEDDEGAKGTRKKKKNTSKAETEEKTGSKSGGFVCDICGDVYKTIHSLKAHRQLHGERRFECEICGKRFHRRDILQEHHTVHQAPQIPCPICNKKLKTKKSLDVHMRCHTGEKPYSCGECGKEFFQKGNLLKHAAVHNPLAKRLLTCDHCNKNFTSRDYLSQHMLEHTQGRIHQCELCDKGFVKEHMLKAHIRQYHGGVTFVCPYCHMSVRYRQSMRRHLEKRHSDMQQEWDVQGFLDKLEAGGNTEVATTSQQTSPVIDNMDILQSDTQGEGGEILLTVSRIPLVEGQDCEEQTDIGSQMELQVETEVQADEVPVDNAFIFNGTVKQEDIGNGEGNILLYVLDTGDVAIDPGYCAGVD